mgnify:CR=1 FL=1
MIFGAAANFLWLAIAFALLRFFGQGSMMLGSAFGVGSDVSIWLTIKAANDSVILNVETYFLWAKKLSQGIQKFFRRR